jgi:hypothetical protein
MGKNRQKCELKSPCLPTIHLGEGHLIYSVNQSLNTGIVMFTNKPLVKVLCKLTALLGSILLTFVSLNSFADDHEGYSQHPDKRVYELRTYTTFPGKLGALETRFRDHTMALFAKHGIENISYWKPLEQPNTLVYVVAHPSLAEAAVAWQAFGTDPAWQAVYAASISDGRLVADINKVFMTKTDYSPLP